MINSMKKEFKLTSKIKLNFLIFLHNGFLKAEARKSVKAKELRVTLK